jgi:hypothetical protein
MIERFEALIGQYEAELKKLLNEFRKAEPSPHKSELEIMIREKKRVISDLKWVLVY